MKCADSSRSSTLPLPTTLRKNGFTYAQLLRGARSCIYRQTYCQNLAYFEVFEIRVQAKKELFGTVIPEKEIFPPDEAFGVWAWTYRGLDQAKRRYEELEGEQEHVEE
jgi:hypothetical protein